jgi:hypothetical protein
MKPSQNFWVKTDKKKPTEAGCYMVYIDHSFVGFSDTIEVEHWDGVSWDNLVNGQKVTHWMDLPRPPDGTWMADKEKVVQT